MTRSQPNLKLPLLGAVLGATLTLSGNSQALPPVNQDPTIPPEYDRPAAPTLALSRTDAAISLRLADSSAYEDGYYIQMRNSSNQWVTIRSSGPLLSYQSLSTTQAGLKPDNRYCFRGAAYNQTGTSYSAIKCAYTYDGNDNQVWRVQLAIETGSGSQSGTNDLVWVRMNSASGNEYPSGNLTVVDYPGQDFNGGTTQTVDLNLTGLSQMSDINTLGIYKSGTDDWCIRSVKLLVNNIEVFGEDYSTAGSDCQNMPSLFSGSSMLSFNRSALRAASSWQNYDEDVALGLLGALGIWNTELVSRLSGMIGHKMYYNELSWRDNFDTPVSITAVCDSSNQCDRLHVDLNLEAAANILDLGTLHPNVDINFDLLVDCDTDALVISTENFTVTADSTLAQEILSVGLVNYVDGQVESAIRDAWEAISQTVSGVPECEVIINQDGDVYLQLVD